MKEKHRIGFYCEQCDEYCLFKEDLEEHMESHVTEVECEEDSEEIECRQCKKKFKSEEEITKHEDDGQECNQCEVWLCQGLNMIEHKKNRHGTTSEEEKKEEVTENPVMEIECEQCYMTFETEEEIIEHENDGQECDQ